LLQSFAKYERNDSIGIERSNAWPFGKPLEEDNMTKPLLHSCVSLAALGMATAGFAADAPKAAAPAAQDDGLSTIVVTASTRDKTRLNTSVSVSSVSGQTIADFQPSSEAELFRLIPGIQVAGTSGPGGNSNIAVRGLPVATGGSPFVQIQEDGLPTVLYGDIQFGNNDYWTHFDASVAKVETVTGGNAATLASQAPGAVINYVSHTNRGDGGFVELQKGLNYNQTKVNFFDAGSINDSLYYNVGGYVNVGNGPLHAPYQVSKSYQVKGNITKEFADNKGFIRFLFKVADTQEPNYTGSPALATITGTNITNIQPYPGFDGRTTSNVSLSDQTFYIVDSDGTRHLVNQSGISTKAKAAQVQLHYDFGGGIVVDDNARYTSMSGSFASHFLNTTLTASKLIQPASAAVAATGTSAAIPAIAAHPVVFTDGLGQNFQIDQIRYANGPNAGQIFTGQFVNDNVNVFTRMRDVGSFVNDLGLTAKVDVGSNAKLNIHAGWFYMSQNIAMDWHVNKSLSELGGANGAQLDFYGTPVTVDKLGVPTVAGAAGNLLTAQGQSGYNNNWGTCCARTYDLVFTDNAPYVDLNLDAGPFGLDGSIRFDSNHASGNAVASAGTVYNTPVTLANAVTGKPQVVNVATFLADGVSEPENYTVNTTSWSVGALYKLNKDTTFYARTSRGARFNSDRSMLNGYFTAAGALNTTSGPPAAVDYVNQHEIGVKNQGTIGGGRYNIEVSLFKANFNVTTYELSATKCPGGAGGCVIANSYKSYGAMLQGAYYNGPFSFTGNATYTHAEQKGSGLKDVFGRAAGIPDLIYTFAANYRFHEMASVGLNVSGQTGEVDSNVGGNSYPGGAIFGGNIKFSPIKHLEFGVECYNLFNRFDLRGNGGISSGNVIGGAPAIGRTVTGSVKFSF
jgi:outer membrane receptor protein involved in Fe transport